MREHLLPGRLGLLERLDSFCRYMGPARGNLVVGEDGGRDEKVHVGWLGRCMVLKLLFLELISRVFGQ